MNKAVAVKATTACLVVYNRLFKNTILVLTPHWLRSTPIYLPLHLNQGAGAVVQFLPHPKKESDATDSVPPCRSSDTSSKRRKCIL
eukprot:scaffold75612_cov66-Attheya_sp.AAC.1